MDRTVLSFELGKQELLRGINGPDGPTGMNLHASDKRGKAEDRTQVGSDGPNQGGRTVRSLLGGGGEKSRGVRWRSGELCRNSASGLGLGNSV